MSRARKTPKAQPIPAQEQPGAPVDDIGPAPPTAPERPALVGEVLPPEPISTVAEFNETAAGLAELRARITTTKYDCTTAEGDKRAREDRRLCVSIRTAIEAKREGLNKPLLEKQRTYNAEAKRIVGIVDELEAIPDKAIKAQEEIEKAAKAERDRVAAEKQAKMDREIARIANMPVVYVSADAAVLRECIASLESHAFAGMEGIWFLRAQNARDAALEAMQGLLVARIRNDEEKAERARQHGEAMRQAAEEREALRVEREQAAAERDRLAKIEAERVAAERAEQDRLRREQQDREDAERAEARRIDNERRAAEDAERARIKAVEDAQREVEAVARHERDATPAEALRIEQERLQAEREALEAEKASIRAEREREAREQAAHEAQAVEESRRTYIDSGTLIQRAIDMAELLAEVGQGDHVITIAGRAAIARETQKLPRKRAA